MYSISEKEVDFQSAIRSVKSFYNEYEVGNALKLANTYKSKGIPVAAIIQYLISIVYTGKSMFCDMKSNKPLAKGFAKDVVYRLLNLSTVNWQTFVLSIANRVVARIDNLTSDERRSAFVIDDTMFHIPYAQKTELVSKVFDHAEKSRNKFKWGFRMFTLGWTDGASFVPLSFRHLASAEKKNRRCEADANIDKRCSGYRTRKEAVMRATEVLITHLAVALKAGISAKYVLFDSWFSHPATVIKVNTLNLHVVCRVKDTSKIKYLLNGEKKTVKQIYSQNKKRRGRSKYLLSTEIMLYSEENKVVASIPAKLVFVRNKHKKSDWIALLCTDMSLLEDEIVALYGKRWDIEVFFKICKSYLKLTGEFQQLSYDALTAHTAIVMVRYMILSVQKRQSEDDRTLGDLFFQCRDELADIQFEQALLLLIAHLCEVLRDEEVDLSETQRELLMNKFINSLPSTFRRCLVPNFVPSA